MDQQREPSSCSLDALPLAPFGVLVVVRALPVSVAVLAFRTGEDEAQLLGGARVEHAPQLVQHGSPDDVHPTDDQNRVDAPAQRHRIAHLKGGRCVEEDGVEPLPELFEDARDRGRADELTGIRRDRARPDHHELVVWDAITVPVLARTGAIRVSIAPGERHRSQNIPELGLAERDLREPRPPAKIEEAVERRTPEIEVDERHTLPSPRERDREVDAGRRLALSLERTCHENRARLVRQAHELEVRAERPKDLCLRAIRLREHDRLVVLAEPSRRLWNAREQRQAETFLDLLGGPNPGVERFPEERERDAQDDAEDETEDAVPDWARLNLRGGVCGFHRHRVAG